MIQLDPQGPLEYDEYGRPIRRRPILPDLAPINQVAQPAPGTGTSAAPAPTIGATAPAGGSATGPQFGPARINMPEPGPAELVYQNKLNAMPQQADYKSGRWSKVFQAIAAGLAGAAKGPQAGIETADALNPYTQAKTKWKEQLAAIAPQVQMEQNRFERGYKASELGTRQTQITAESQAAEARNKRELSRDEQVANHEKMMEIINLARANKKSPIEIEMDMARQNPDFYKRFNEMRHPKESFEESLKKFEAQEKIRLNYAGPIAKAGELGRQAGKPQEDYTQVIESARNIASGETQNPGRLAEFIKMLPAKTKNAVLAALPVSTIVSPKERDKVDNASTSLKHVSSLREMIEDPYIKSHLGPIIGRIEDFQGRWGGKPSGATPDEIRKEQEFLNFMNMAMTWEASVYGSNRPSWQLIQQLKSQGIKTALDPARFQGALDAMERSAHNTILGALGGTSSKAPDPKEGGFNWGSVKLNEENK